ncbi:hypothetical protein QN277_003812 [Acacia crassicarpa]|uniref:Uncharacterized protein n=1 Tax=Acacia crassicarpa TaxID=499986 RepID=A0AAE1JWN7_9FABA|nr:hypothetical protein QN277_003812 [Acacia crassicarpa]
MAYSLSCLCRFNQAVSWHRTLFHYPKMRSQSFRDNGKPENRVDANMSVLRERINRIRRREKFVDRCGWNYKNNHGYEKTYKRSSNHHQHQALISEFAELMAITCGSIGLVFLFGSLFICLVSLFVFISKN